MILSLTEKFLFIHVYKVAGTSIVQALGKTDFRHTLRKLLPKTTSLYLRCLGINPRALWMHDHALAKDVRAMMRMSVFESLFKVGFVRNPWDLQVSLYNYNLRNPKARHAGRDLTSFESFIKSAPENEFPLGQQKRFLFDDTGAQLVDFIGRYETLNDDFRKVCSAIGLEDAELKHWNATEHAPWQTYYTPELFEIVRLYAQADIAAFGYADDPAAYAIH